MRGEADDDLVAVGQLMASLRKRRTAPAKTQERAETRTEQLATIDGDWDCPWPLDWQRRNRVLA
ncbi:hypothetical protein OHA98_21310 [Streptomyces sp. NBC_00654]|uniref:hypothetical protein n=1 Tax=Streptomyces sp. NBC_00654 TaxID=2975799 RepID=UPI00225A7574|nr:hypothetical protein [Streptomyces sp. NBC_00654]MCX4967258.1 hypothetical protein [Streptomyces sp. NBC_00654]